MDSVVAIVDISTSSYFVLLCHLMYSHHLPDATLKSQMP
jgi:hypothetical protein